MSHAPPVPSGNQSPYPREERPHVHRGAASDDVVTIPDGPDAAVGAAGLTGLAAAVVVGIAALAAGIWWATPRFSSTRETRS